MARFATVMVRISVLRRADGLVAGVRVHASKLGDSLFWLDRETNTLDELRRHGAPGEQPRN